MLLVLCDNGFVFKRLCSAPEEEIKHLTCKLKRLKEQANWSWSYDNGLFKQLCAAPEEGHGTPEVQTEQAEESRRTL